MFGFHYFMWAVMAVIFITLGMMGSGAIDAYRIKAEQDGRSDILLKLPLQALTMLTFDKE